MRFVNKDILKINIDNFIKDINKLFINSNTDIKKLLEDKKIITRERKLSFRDVL